MNAQKALLASAFDRIGINQAMLNGLKRSKFPYIRVLNYHGTPARTRESLSKQLDFFKQNFSPVSAHGLESFLNTGEWLSETPGLIISFDDGLRSNFDVAVPLLVEYGFVGWFFVPCGFIDCPPSGQKAFAREHSIKFDEAETNERIAMSWNELRGLVEKHVVGCHTANHHRMVASTTIEQLEREITGAKARMQEKLSRDVDHFCWVGGEESTYSTEAARVVREAAFKYGFMTNNALLRPRDDPFHIQRTNVEAGWPMEVVRFQVGGVMDLLYSRKRSRVNRLTSG